jgi:hypothetical protein
MFTIKTLLGVKEILDQYDIVFTLHLGLFDLMKRFFLTL